MTLQKLWSSSEHAGLQHSTGPSSRQWCVSLLLYLQATRALPTSPRAEPLPCILSDHGQSLRAQVLQNRRLNSVKRNHIHSSGYYTHFQPFCFPKLFLCSSLYTVRTQTLCGFQVSSSSYQLLIWSLFTLILTSSQSHLCPCKAECPDLAETLLVPSLSLLNLETMSGW